MTDVHVTSAVAAPIWQTNTSRKLPYVPTIACSPPKSRTALRATSEAEAGLTFGVPPIAKQSKFPRHPSTFINEATRSSVRFVIRHSKASRSMVESSVCPARRSRMSV